MSPFDRRPAVALTSADPFDPAAEVRVIAELLLRHSARLVSSPSQRQVVSGLCEALTHSTPRILLAWTWFGPTQTHHIVPQIIAGSASRYADSLVIDESAITRSGPVFRALSGLPTTPSVVSADSPFEPWRRAATLYGIRSSLALPLRSHSKGLRGICVLYASLPDYFERVGVSLFEALGELFGALLSAASDRTALELAANSDALTGLGNRRLLADAERTLSRSSASSAPASVLLLDLDHFKNVNDRLGHRAGDQVLREIAGFLRTLVRESDWVLRWGGEEFLVCIPGADLSQALAAARKIRESVAAARFDSGRVALTLSIGVAEVGVAVPLSAAIEAADTALYEAKRAGRDRVVAAGATTSAHRLIPLLTP